MESRNSADIVLKWITKLLGELDIQYQVVGGLAAKCYGSSRPLHDIDFYVPGDAIPILKRELEEFIKFGPSHHKDEHWDITFMKIRYKGWQIEFGDSNNASYFDIHSESWKTASINFEESIMIAYHEIKLPVMPKEQLIAYKHCLNRKVDQIDIRQIESS